MSQNMGKVQYNTAVIALALAQSAVARNWQVHSVASPAAVPQMVYTNAPTTNSTITLTVGGQRQALRAMAERGRGQMRAGTRLFRPTEHPCSNSQSEESGGVPPADYGSQTITVAAASSPAFPDWWERAGVRSGPVSMMVPTTAAATTHQRAYRLGRELRGRPVPPACHVVGLPTAARQGAAPGTGARGLCKRGRAREGILAALRAGQAAWFGGLLEEAAELFRRALVEWQSGLFQSSGRDLAVRACARRWLQACVEPDGPWYGADSPGTVVAVAAERVGTYSRMPAMQVAPARAAELRARATRHFQCLQRLAWVLCVHARLGWLSSPAEAGLPDDVVELVVGHMPVSGGSQAWAAGAGAYGGMMMRGDDGYRRRRLRRGRDRAIVAFGGEADCGVRGAAGESLAELHAAWLAALPPEVHAQLRYIEGVCTAMAGLAS
jgi:hypothetical protein